MCIFPRVLTCLPQDPTPHCHFVGSCHPQCCWMPSSEGAPRLSVVLLALKLRNAPPCESTSLRRWLVGAQRRDGRLHATKASRGCGGGEERRPPPWGQRVRWFCIQEELEVNDTFAYNLLLGIFCLKKNTRIPHVYWQVDSMCATWSNTR
jgi:hypothetical protein